MSYCPWPTRRRRHLVAIQAIHVIHPDPPRHDSKLPFFKISRQRVAVQEVIFDMNIIRTIILTKRLIDCDTKF